MTDQLDKFSTAYLHQRLDYNPITGIFTWNRIPEFRRHDRVWNANFADKTAGGLTSYGYIEITLDGVPLRSHRLAYKMTYGEGAPFDIDVDHIDRIKHHNWISNLRLATRSQTNQNKNLQSNNTSGMRGVWLINKDKPWKAWRAQIRTGRKKISLGCFTTLEDAIAARQKAELELFGEFSPLRNP